MCFFFGETFRNCWRLSRASCHSSFRCPDFVTDLAVSGAFVLSLWGWAIVVTYNCLYQLYADVCRPHLCFQRSFITLWYVFRWYGSINVTLLGFVLVEIEITFWRAEELLNARQGKEEVKSIWNVLVSSNLVSSVQLVKSSSAKLTGNCFV